MVSNRQSIHIRQIEDLQSRGTILQAVEALFEAGHPRSLDDTIHHVPGRAY